MTGKEKVLNYFNPFTGETRRLTKRQYNADWKKEAPGLIEKIHKAGLSMQDNRIPFIHEPQPMSDGWFQRINKLRKQYPLSQLRHSDGGGKI